MLCVFVIINRSSAPCVDVFDKIVPRLINIFLSLLPLSDLPVMWVDRGTRIIGVTRCDSGQKIRYAHGRENTQRILAPLKIHESKRHV